MVDDSYLHCFQVGFIYRPNSMIRPWNSKMSDEELLVLYEKAIEAKVNDDFIKLLLYEMKKRIVNKLKANPVE